MRQTPAILVTEDNALVRIACSEMLKTGGFDVAAAENGEEANAALGERSFDAALLDMRLPDADGRELLADWRSDYPDMPIIIMTAHGDIGSAVECIKVGAHDFLPKPVDQVLLEKAVRHAVDQRRMSRELEARSKLQQREADTNIAFGPIVAKGEAMIRAVSLAKRVAESDFSCMFLRGESGTGKGVFARTIHQVGQRSGKPFVEVNCSALPSTLIESELFGYTKGAFTDAKQDKEGLFELADGGTIFLDEIGDMDVGLQAKLLKVIEDQRFRRLGGVRDVEVDVAVIAATHQKVESLVEAGTFRLDLFYRLNVIPVSLPPLREHPEDIDALCRMFLETFSKKFGNSIPAIAESTMEVFRNHDWPGNVRELSNVIERGCLLAGSGTITDEHILFTPEMLAGAAATPHLAQDVDAGEVLSLADAERRAIRRAMDAVGGNKNEATRLLGIHRTTLYKKLAEYGLD